ncbi:MAG: ergothioneine biosynthesis protein EgtB [Planctomycetota bacterium]
MNSPTTTQAIASSAGALARYQQVRALSVRLADRLSAEDCQVQSMTQASPVKWHLAHTTWFFETFVLAEHEPEFSVYDERYPFLFNSYYNACGDRHRRDHRGLVTRPGLGEVLAYRQVVDERIERLVRDGGLPRHALRVFETGLHHEQQHQELAFTDLKHAFWSNPLEPAYTDTVPESGRETSLGWLELDEGVYEIGHAGDGFAYDNESPRHRVFIEPCTIADRLVTNGEFQRFIDDGGYRRSELWLDDGWRWVQNSCAERPIYWGGNGSEFTLAGRRALDPHAPVCSVGFFEADAYARWAGARLPTEAEWEAAFAPGWTEADETRGVDPNGPLHPRCASESSPCYQAFGVCWQWTGSAYRPYPGYRPPTGALGEYNGKFMNGCYSLRGGSCLTPPAHNRLSYRNFFAPDARWQMTSIRLCKDRHA